MRILARLRTWWRERGIEEVRYVCAICNINPVKLSPAIRVQLYHLHDDDKYLCPRHYIEVNEVRRKHNLTAKEAIKEVRKIYIARGGIMYAD